MLDKPLNGCNYSSVLWIALAAAGQISMPVPVGLRFPDVRAVFSYEDMPAYVQIEGVTRFVFTRTTVRADGTTQDCTLEQASGDSKLDAFTCSIILKRAKFQPARWLDGSPAYGVLRMPVIWAIGGPPSKREVQEAYPADMYISVSHLPTGADAQTDVGLIIAVDENGRVVNCAARPQISAGDHEKRFPELVPIACAEMMSNFTAIPSKDASGAPVHSIQNASVAFTTDRSQSK